MKTMRKCNDEIYQLAKDQGLVKKFIKKKKKFCNLQIQKLPFFLSLILFPTLIVVNDINFGSTKVIQ